MVTSCQQPCTLEGKPHEADALQIANGPETFGGLPSPAAERTHVDLRHASAVLSGRLQDLTCLKPIWAYQPAAVAACLSDLLSAPQAEDAQSRLGIMPALHDRACQAAALTWPS